MLFCPSFTQSERFLQTDQLIIRLQVVVVIIFIRMLMRNVIVNVFKSDAVVWWAAFFCKRRPKRGLRSRQAAPLMEIEGVESRPQDRADVPDKLRNWQHKHSAAERAPIPSEAKRQSSVESGLPMRYVTTERRTSILLQFS